MRAKEEKTGALDWVEEKMARATMIPRAHGEVCLCLPILHVNHEVAWSSDRSPC